MMPSAACCTSVRNRASAAATLAAASRRSVMSCTLTTMPSMTGSSSRFVSEIWHQRTRTVAVLHPDVVRATMRPGCDASWRLQGAHAARRLRSSTIALASRRPTSSSTEYPVRVSIASVANTIIPVRSSTTTASAALTSRRRKRSSLARERGRRNLAIARAHPHDAHHEHQTRGHQHRDAVAAPGTDDAGRPARARPPLPRRRGTRGSTPSPGRPPANPRCATAWAAQNTKPTDSTGPQPVA